MHLQIGQNVDNKRVRLDFRKSPAKPDSLPSYTIEKHKADEFVKKFNTEEKKLTKITAILAALGGTLGLGLGIKSRSIVKTSILGAGGSVFGAGIGILHASDRKKRLMSKFGVKEI